MTKPLRAALVSLPFISAGLLSWLPVFYLFLRRPHRRPLLYVTVIQIVVTVAILLGLFTSDPHGVKHSLWAILYLWLTVMSAVIVWAETSLRAQAEDTPVPDNAG